MGDVTALMMDVITEKSGHQVVPMAVSVCTTPAAPSPLPIPYPVLGNSSEGIIDPPMRTKVNGVPTATVGSCIKQCHGNEPGTLKEVVSLNTTGPCFIIMGAPIVLIELGMAGITGSPCISNKAITVGAPANASDAGGTGGAGGGGGGGGSGGGNAQGAQGPQGGGGAGGGGSNSGAGGPGGGGGGAGSSSGPASQHQCQNGHPVDVVSGYVVDTATDISLPGLIPFAFTRTYSSSRRGDREATLGPGWAHGFEQRIVEGDEVITLREGEGRSVWFAKIKPGESTFHRRERMTLHRDGEGDYRVHRLADRLTYVFGASRAGGPALLRAIRDAWDNAITFEYEGERLTRIVDTAGREIRVKWKESRIARLEVHAEGRLELWHDYAYSTSGCLVAATDALGFADAYEYDRYHRMTAAEIKTGVRFQYEYEANTGKCKKTWGPKGLYAIELRIDPETKTTFVDGEEPRVVTWNDQGVATRIATPDGTVIEEKAYDDDGYLVARVNGAGEGHQYWYDARGELVRVVDAAGNVTSFERDDEGLPTRKTSADGQSTTYVHDAKGALSVITYPSGETYSLAYDARGRPTAVNGPTGARALEYDGRHCVVAETDARGARTTFAYDALGRPVMRTDALGRATRVTYDRLGRRLSLRTADGASRQWAYDARGECVREIDALGRSTLFERAGMGVVTRMTLPDGGRWAFKYTSQELLAEIENPLGETYAFVRDEAGRVVEETTFDGRTIVYGYSRAGRVDRVQYPDGSHRAFTYDRLGRPTLEVASDDSTVTYQYDRLGRLLGATLQERDQRIVTTFERDALGRVVAERQGDRVVRYAYDAADRRVQRVMPDGARTTYGYDAEGVLSGVEHAGHRLVIERDALGREIRRGDGAGRFSVRSVYDAADRLVEQRVDAPSPGGGVPAVLAQRQWQYDANGRVVRVDDGRWGTTAYAYDRIGQLLSARSASHREVFEYDAAGSLIQLLDGLSQGERDPRWTVRRGNLLASTPRASYAYDARGRRSGKLSRGAAPAEGGGETQYRWDIRDRLREVRLPSGDRIVMTYDAFGRRIRKETVTPEGTRKRAVELVWDQDSIAADIDSERGARCFVHAPGTMVLLLQAERGEVFTYVNDHLGTPRELIDASGRLAWAASHSAWGETIAEHHDEQRPHRVESPFRLPGQYADAETGLCSTRFRHFDPEVGRWCSPDPLGIAGGSNLFGFGGAPTVDIDPLGLSHLSDKEKAEIQKSMRSLEQRRDEHIEKLAKYKANPDAYDNKGFLKDASPEVRERIIKGRERHLQGEIDNFNKQISGLQKKLDEG